MGPSARDRRLPRPSWSKPDQQTERRRTASLRALTEKIRRKSLALSWVRTVVLSCTRGEMIPWVIWTNLCREFSTIWRIFLWPLFVTIQHESAKLAAAVNCVRHFHQSGKKCHLDIWCWDDIILFLLLTTLTLMTVISRNFWYVSLLVCAENIIHLGFLFCSKFTFSWSNCDNICLRHRG